MQMEVEAESKAHAERKGREAGMNVHHVRDISDGAADPTGINRGPSQRGSSGGGKLKLIIILAILLAAAWFFRGTIMGMIGK